MNALPLIRRPLLLVVLAAACSPESHRFSPSDEHIFKGLSGPSQPTVVAPPQPTLARYASGGTSRVAILLTDPNSAWLGLAHGLKSAGVPFIITTDYQRAARHHVVFVYPTISGKLLSSVALRTLAAIPRNGGIGFGVLGGGLEEVFGFTSVSSARTRHRLRFASDSPLLDLPLTELSLGNDPRQPAIGSDAFASPREVPLATYDDGSAAVIHRSFGQGHAFAFGIDVGFLLSKGFNNRAEDVERMYVNGFNPYLDVLLLLLRRIAEMSDQMVTIGTVRNGRSVTVMMTHDIDYGKSLTNALAYANLLRSLGVHGTFFTQTKYIRDYNDHGFFDDSAPPVLRQLAATGMEIASHGVSHSKAFKDFPLGTGSEKYPDYHPFVSTDTTAEDGSIFGELRVSKFLLDHFSGAPPVVSFRPGDLANAPQLPQALAATGYRYSSSVTANDSITHLPFQLAYGRMAAGEVPVYEFPVTIEDEEAPPLEQRVNAAVAVVRKIARYGGCAVVLVHPNVVEPKIRFEREFIEQVCDIAEFATVRDFGSWWEARDHVDVDLENDSIAIKASQPIDGLTLRVPMGWQFISTPAVSQNGRVLTISHLAGELRLRFTIHL